MISCKSCRTTYTCACNLINGLCHSCYSKRNNFYESYEVNLNTEHTEHIEKKTLKMDLGYTKPVQSTEISDFLKKSKGLTQEEKIRRINLILQKARENKNKNEDIL